MANITTDMIKDLRERTGVGMMDCKRALSETDGDIDKAIRLLKEKGAITAAKKSERNAKEGIIGFCINEDKTVTSCVELQCETDFVAKNENFQALASSISKAGLNVKESTVEALEKSKVDGVDTVTDLINAIIQKMGEKTVLSNFKRLETSGFFGYYVHFTKKLVTVVEFDKKVKTEKGFELANQIAMHVASEKPIAVNRDEVDADVIKEQREIFEKITLESGKKGDMVAKIVDGKMNAWFAECVLIDQKLFTDNKISIKSLVDEMSKDAGSEITIKSMTVMSIGS